MWEPHVADTNYKVIRSSEQLKYLYCTMHISNVLAVYIQKRIGWKAQINTSGIHYGEYCFLSVMSIPCVKQVVMVDKFMYNNTKTKQEQLFVKTSGLMKTQNMRIWGI